MCSEIILQFVNIFKCLHVCLVHFQSNCCRVGVGERSFFFKVVFNGTRGMVKITVVWQTNPWAIRNCYLTRVTQSAGRKLFQDSIWSLFETLSVFSPGVHSHLHHPPTGTNPWTERSHSKEIALSLLLWFPLLICLELSMVTTKGQQITAKLEGLKLGWR